MEGLVGGRKGEKVGLMIVYGMRMGFCKAGQELAVGFKGFPFFVCSVLLDERSTRVDCG